MPQFIIIAKDFTDDDALNRRLAARPAHLQRMREEKAKNVFIIGGAKLNHLNQMFGSMLIIDLPDEAAAKNWVSQDPYVTGRVWDTIEITPFKIAEV